MRAGALVLALLLAGCGSEDVVRVAEEPPPSDSVPEEFRPACGKPGSRVDTERLEVVVEHAACDLTGVTIANQGRSAVVPDPGTGVANSSGVTIDVAANGDVTFTAEAEVPQY